MTVLTGVFRFVRHADVIRRLVQGWRVAFDLGETHGQWSVAMWWCCGDCDDCEHGVPQ